MKKEMFRVIDMRATGQNIWRIMDEQGKNVRELQYFFGFESPNAIYKWLHGDSLPSLDNLYALAGFFRTTIDEILVPREKETTLQIMDR